MSSDVNGVEDVGGLRGVGQSGKSSCPVLLKTWHLVDTKANGKMGDRINPI